MTKKIFFIAIISFVIDQITKGIISTYMMLNQSLKIINSFFNITYINNTGASWGILENNKTILIILSFIAIIVIIRYINSFKKIKRNIIGLGLILGGITGNLADRILFGYVKDFLDFKIFNYNYPIFNIADSCLVIGVFLIIISIIKGEDKDGSKGRKKRINKNR